MGVIVLMLLFFYRSIITVLLVLVMLVLGLSVTRGVVAFLGYHELIGLSTFATQLLVTLAIAATTDYAIFLIGRYQEARTIGEDRETAYYTMFRGTAHVVLGSGMTIAGATFCLSFTRLPYFQTLGIPLAVGMVVAVLVALTLGPAMITVASRFGLLEPKRAMRIRFWRRLGAAVVRWPGWILLGTIILALVGLLTLPGYQPSYNDRKYLPADLPANEGFAAAERHFPISRMNPEMLLVETDKDLRNSADFLVIDRITKAVTRVPGIGRVQSITRPEGKPLKFSTIPAQLSMSGTFQEMNRSYMEKTMNNMLVQADDMQTTLDTMNRMIALMEQMSAMTHDMVGKMNDMSVDVAELRDHISDFDDFFRPVRNYLYWEPHCYNIPICWSLRSTFDALDGVDTMTDDFQNLLPDLNRLDALMPQMIAAMGPTIETLKSSRTMMLTMYASQSSQQDQTTAMNENQSAMGDAFNDSHNDDTFYLPPEIFDNKDFKRGMDNFISPDGHAVRFIISHENDPLSADGIGRIDAIKSAAFEAIKGTPLEGSRVYIGGTASTFKDMQEGNKYDLMIAGVAALTMIFIIMLLITREPGRGRRHRRHRGAVAGCVLRAVGSALAAPAGHGIAIHGDGDGGHHPVGSRCGLQPVVGGADEGGDTGRDQHRNHPCHGRQRIRRDRGRPGVRVHHDVDGGQRHGRGRPGRHDDRVGPVVRHVGHSGIHDAVDRSTARSLVLVAADRPDSTRAGHPVDVSVMCGGPRRKD